MYKYNTKQVQAVLGKANRKAAEIQAEIDLRLLAEIHLGKPLFSTSSADTHMNPFDPDGSELHISHSHYRDPATGSGGDAIKFIQKVKSLSCAGAIAYLEGWLDCQGRADLHGENAHLHNQKIEDFPQVEKSPVQLALFALRQERLTND